MRLIIDKVTKIEYVRTAFQLSKVYPLFKEFNFKTARNPLHVFLLGHVNEKIQFDIIPLRKGENIELTLIIFNTNFNNVYINFLDEAYIYLKEMQTKAKL